MTVKTSPRPATDPLTDHEPLDAARWAQLAAFDAVLEDYTGAGWKVTANGSSRVITVGAVGNVCSVRRHLGRITVTETLDLGALGDQPSSTQERYTHVVARFHRAGSLLNSITVEAITGTPALIGTATTPAPLRDSTAWDLSLGVVRQQGTLAIAQNAVTDTRAHWGPTLYIPDRVTVTTAYPVGTVLQRDSYRQHRALTSAGSPYWAGDVLEYQIPNDGPSNTQWSLTPSFVGARGGNVTVQLNARRAGTAITGVSNQNNICILPEPFWPTRLRYADMRVVWSPPGEGRQERSCQVYVDTNGAVILIGPIVTDGRVQGSITFPQRPL